MGIWEFLKAAMSLGQSPLGGVGLSGWAMLQWCQDIKVIATVDATPVESIRIGLYDDCYATSIHSHFSTCFSLPTGRWSEFSCGDTVKRVRVGWLESESDSGRQVYGQVMSPDTAMIVTLVSRLWKFGCWLAGVC